MGANNNKKIQTPATQAGYGPNAGRSGSDPRGRIQNQGQYQQQRYEQQQGPLVNYAAQNYGRGAETGFTDYGDIMNRFRDLGGPSGGYAKFAETGGFSPEEIAAIRARGIAPIRAAYSNAEREVARQRSLQGGYAPNAIAAQAKMAREQGQEMADASTNVEAAIAEMRNKGKQFGLAGQADVLRNMGSLYGTSPGMAETFGNQAINLVGQGGDFGLGLMRNEIAGQQLPGQYDTTMGRISDISTMAYPWLEYLERQRKQKQAAGLPPVQGPPEAFGGPVPVSRSPVQYQDDPSNY